MVAKSALDSIVGNLWQQRQESSGSSVGNQVKILIDFISFDYDILRKWVAIMIYFCLHNIWYETLTSYFIQGVAFKSPQTLLLYQNLWRFNCHTLYRYSDNY